MAAIDAVSGQTLWKFDPGTYKNPPPGNVGYVSRGVTYWSDGQEQRILVATGDAYLISLDARNGRPDPNFGQRGRVDLTLGLRRPVKRGVYGVTSPPALVGERVIVGSSILDAALAPDPPPGDVRAFDVRTGRLVWTFHSIPQPGEWGQDSWEQGSGQKAGHTNVWSPMSVDEERGLVYLPFSTPTNDNYGGERPGHNLYADALVCVKARSGERVWHFQMVHHGLWDYDLPAAPVLMDIEVDGRPIAAAAQVTKQGFVFVFDRHSGQPVWPIEERQVPPSDIPSERISPTQPFPTRPPPFERQGLEPSDLIDFTAELRREALEIIGRYRFGPLFTPPSEQGTVNLPGNSGGAYWAGAAFDPASDTLFIPSVTAPYLLTLKPDPEPDAPFRYRSDPEADLLLRGPAGLPAVKPPYSRVTAIDLNEGEIWWMTPLGEGPRNHPLLKSLKLPRLGSGGRGLVLATASLLFVGEGLSVEQVYNSLRRLPPSDCCANRPRFHALDKDSGEIVWEMDLPAYPSGSPMTYAIDDRQLIVIPIGGLDEPAELIALALPED